MDLKRLIGRPLQAYHKNLDQLFLGSQMKKKLIKVKLIDKFGTDLTVVNCARVSFNRVSEELNERDEKLIKYLFKHQHTSPFRHCFLQWRIEAPIFILRQWQKHQVGC